MHSESTQLQVQQIVDIITRTVEPEKIFLLGSSCTTQYIENIFSEKPVNYTLPVHFDFLVISHASDTRPCNELQDIIENACRSFIAVTIVVQPIHRFNQLLGAGEVFNCTVLKTGKLVYDAGNIPFETPGPIVSGQVLQKQFSKWFDSSKEFLAGSELYIIRKQYKMAAFMLHQAAERAYVSLILLLTGYRASTHNLDKLIRYSKSFSAELAMIFPRNNEKEEYLFQLLQKAYIHSRYKDDYNIRGEQVFALLARVKKIQEIARYISKENMSLHSQLGNFL